MPKKRLSEHLKFHKLPLQIEYSFYELNKTSIQVRTQRSEIWRWYICKSQMAEHNFCILLVNVFGNILQEF